MKKGHEVEVATLPKCDIHAMLHDGKPAPDAAYDGKTMLGPWANMCEEHWKTYGPGRTGTGMGQRLILREVKNDGS
jgi:hypothetical protein